MHLFVVIDIGYNQLFTNAQTSLEIFTREIPYQLERGTKHFL